MNTMRRSGFTLLELMIVVAIVATLAAIALPPYDRFIQRGRILEAVTRLADARARMDEFFLDRRTYVDDAGRCGFAPVASAADFFIVQCEATATTFTYTARGLATLGMSAFAYAIDQTGAKATVSLPTGWSRTPDCWTIRPDGLCI